MPAEIQSVKVTKFINQTIMNQFRPESTPNMNYNFAVLFILSAHSPLLILNHLSLDSMEMHWQMKLFSTQIPFA